MSVRGVGMGTVAGDFRVCFVWFLFNAEGAEDAEGEGFVERWVSRVLHSTLGETEVIDGFGCLLLVAGGVMPFLSSVKARRRWVRSRLIL